MMNRRPFGPRKTVRLTLGLTILAWATQTLFHQWGFGAEVTSDDVPPQISAEKFVPEPTGSDHAATIELRSEATVNGPEVRLKQICRWSNADAPAFTTVGELVMVRFSGSEPFKTVTLDDIRKTLSDAGANVGRIDFAGPTRCTISRSDVQYDASTALDQWIAARQPQGTLVTNAKAAAAPSADSSAPAAPAASVVPAIALASSNAASPIHTLGELLQQDLATHLNLTLDQLQVNFNPADQKLLNLAEPQFKFNIDGSFNRNLGNVSWDVLIVSDGGNRKVNISAQARAWQNQLEFERPLGRGEVIRTEDLRQRHVLVDQVSSDTPLTIDQVVGQQASRDIQPGFIATGQMVESVPLARTGQFITVTLNSGGVNVKTVARAMESGSYGQTIKVRSDDTDQTYEVVLTGPQQGTVGPMNDSRNAVAVK